MSRTLLPASLRKELRALSVPWLASVAAIAASAVVGGRMRGIAMPAYVLGAVALGAVSMGHEYSDRTITLLLSQPVRRERLLLGKLSGLATLLVALFAAAGIFMLYTAGFAGMHTSEWAAVLLLPVICSLCLGPWLTMLCRSAMAGTVFSLAVPGILLIAGELIGILRYGSRDAAEDFRMLVLWTGTLGVCAIGGLLGWRTFMRLEAMEGRGQDMQLPRWLRRRSTPAAVTTLTKRHPVWLLVNKELRLQQMPLAIGALYLIAWAGVTSVRHMAPDLMDAFIVMSVFYGGLISLLIGSLACAEERQMGTLEWQVLLPMATWKQWAVKVSVALGLATVLALGLPLLLVGAARLVPTYEPRVVLALPVIALTIGALYVSSLYRNGVSALLMSLATLSGVVLFTTVMMNPLAGAVALAVVHFPTLKIPHDLALAIDRFILPSALLLLPLSPLPVVLRFALMNYRMADHAPARVLRQAFWIASCLTLALTLMVAVLVALDG